MLAELLIELRDAFAHVHDRPYLVRHSLMRYVSPRLSGDAIVAADDLRRLLLQALGELRPQDSTPPGAPAWRPYSVMHRRYVLGQDPEQIEHELALGTRQMQREQRRGLELIALALLGTEAGSLSVFDTQEESALAEELSRLPSSQVVVEAREQWERAVAATRALAESQGVSIAEATGADGVLLLGDPAVLRLLFVSALSLAVKLVPQGWVTAAFGRDGERVCCRLSATTASGAAPLPDRPELPPRLCAMAKAQRAEIRLSATGNRVEMVLDLPAAPRERTIAIVEDNKDVVELFSRYLKGRGYRLLPVGDATRALDEIRMLAPEAIILDVMMREVDGWEVLQWLKADTLLSQIPVIVCSVLSEPELATSLGAATSLVKPVRPAQLLGALDRLLA